MAEKSDWLFMTDLQWKRYSFTITTGATPGLGRVGIRPPHNANYGAAFWGFQVEENSFPTRLTYTYDTSFTPTATTSGTFDPRVTFLPPGGVVSYTASFTINQAAMDGGEFVSNVASVTGIFTTPSGITVPAPGWCFKTTAPKLY